jgi:hypothetical protein
MREPHPVRLVAVTAGLAGTVAWLAGFGALATNLGAYTGWVLAAGAVAWLGAIALSRRGDRGVAVGIAVALAIGWSSTALALAITWIRTGAWPLW